MTEIKPSRGRSEETSGCDLWIATSPLASKDGHLSTAPSLLATTAPPKRVMRQYLVGVRFVRLAKTVSAQFDVERLAAEAEHFGGRRSVLACQLERCLDA